MRVEAKASASRTSLGTGLRARLLVAAGALVFVRVVIACGTPGLTESDSCERRGGYCGVLGPDNDPECNSLTDTIYLDTCVCCVPFDAASVVTVTPTGDASSTGGDAGASEGGGSGTEAGVTTEAGASDAASDAADGGG